MAATAPAHVHPILRYLIKDPNWIAKKMQKKIAPPNKTKPGVDYPAVAPEIDAPSSDSQISNEQLAE